MFFAESDRPWILDGAHVHVSMIGFDDGTEKSRLLDGKQVETINSNLTAIVDVTAARSLEGTRSIAFQGPVKVGAFDIPPPMTKEFLQGTNPHARPNSDVLFPWVNGADITRRPRHYWIIDFGDFELPEACKYEGPFSFVEREIKPKRIKNADRQRREFWWRLGRSGADWKNASAGLARTLFTPRVSKHRVFCWFARNTVPDSAVVGFATAEDRDFGVLHSRVHEVWARAMGTQLRERESGFRYTPKSCFETFPFPDVAHEEGAAIAEAARELDGLRNNWLNPPEWTREEVLEFPGSADGPWSRYVHKPNKRGIGTVRYPRMVPRDEECAKELKRRTLTNLYNERPTWLDLAHKRLDEAVFAAYGWDPALSDEALLERLLKLNLERAGQ
jgi:hypothetical protein